MLPITPSRRDMTPLPGDLRRRLLRTVKLLPEQVPGCGDRRAAPNPGSQGSPLTGHPKMEGHPAQRVLVSSGRGAGCQPFKDRTWAPSSPQGSAGSVWFSATRSGSLASRWLFQLLLWLGACADQGTLPEEQQACHACCPHAPRSLTRNFLGLKDSDASLPAAQPVQELVS